MIQQETYLKVADNSGARVVRCVKVLGGSRRRYARVGDTIVCSVREAQSKGVAKKGDLSRAVVVRTCGRIQRIDGSVLRFYDNSCVLMDDKNNPRGTRVFGPIAREVRERAHLKIASLAPEVW